MDFDEDKPITIAVEEFMENELEWRKTEEDIDE